MPLRVFRKQTVWYVDPEGRRCAPDAPGADKRERFSKNYYGSVRQADGRRKHVPLCTDKAMSQVMHAKLIVDAALASKGIVDPFAGHKSRLLAEHLTDFAANLTGNGSPSRHVELVISRIRLLLDGVKATLVADLDSTRVSKWLAAVRQPKRTIALPADKPDFKPSEVADLLGISGAALRAAVVRHGLAAVGNGKARRYPRSTVEALVNRKSQGVAPETVNHYIRAMRSFIRWMVEDDRIPKDPFRTIRLVRVGGEHRHARRALTVDEMRRLLDAARRSHRVFRGLTGTDRSALYAAACGTGFRASALASLTPKHFNLGGSEPTVSLAIRDDKSGKGPTQPLPPDVAELLAGYLVGRPAGLPVWGGRWARDKRAAEMLRIDLASAGIPYKVDGLDGPLHADFHALRHSYITALNHGGVDLRTAQKLANHSSPALTARYTHPDMGGLAAAVGKIGNIVPPAVGET